jgi:carbon-monoxide dehydrogenase medium subunit
LTPFELHRPQTLPEAIALLADETARPFSGGTAVMLMMKAGVLRPSRLVSLENLALGKTATGPDGALHVGAMATLRSLERSPLVRQGWPVIARALRTLSNVRVRNVATIGGHLAHGDPHTDLPPLLCALGATVTVFGRNGERRVPVEQLYAGYLETTLKAGELITQVQVPALGAKRAVYLKCTTRSVDDWPAVGVAVAVDASETRIFISAAVDKPTRISSLQDIEKISIDSDLHGSADYKRQLSRVYLKRALDETRNAGR